jgi:hypothetical protein
LLSSLNKKDVKGIKKSAPSMISAPSRKNHQGGTTFSSSKWLNVKPRIMVEILRSDACVLKIARLYLKTICIFFIAGLLFNLV